MEQEDYRTRMTPMTRIYTDFHFLDFYLSAKTRVNRSLPWKAAIIRGLTNAGSIFSAPYSLPVNTYFHR